MPIEYRIDHGLGVVSHEFTGEISFADLAHHWRRLLSDPELPDPLVMFADLRRCRMLVRGEDTSRLVHAVIQPLLKGRRWVSAVVADSNAEYGVTKQFTVYSSHCGETEVFREESEAVAWLLGAAAPKAKAAD